jgi:hypothetical protein
MKSAKREVVFFMPSGWYSRFADTSSHAPPPALAAATAAAVRPRIHVAQAMQNLGPVVADVFQCVAGVIRQAAAMAEHVAQRDLPRDPRIVHGKFGIVANDRIVPRD